MSTLYIDKHINGVNFEIELYFEKSYQSNDYFEPDDHGFIEIINITTVNNIKVSDRVYNAIMELEDIITQEFQETMKDYFI